MKFLLFALFYNAILLYIHIFCLFILFIYLTGDQQDIVGKGKLRTPNMQMTRFGL